MATRLNANTEPAHSVTLMKGTDDEAIVSPFGDYQLALINRPFAYPDVRDPSDEMPNAGLDRGAHRKLACDRHVRPLRADALPPRGNLLPCCRHVRRRAPERARRSQRRNVCRLSAVVLTELVRASRRLTRWSLREYP